MWAYQYWIYESSWRKGAINSMTNLEELEQYKIERDVFCQLFNKHGNLSSLMWDFLPDYTTYNFKIFQIHDEFYFLHLPSGTVINWYKHEGRTNTCNKDLTLDEYERFFKMLYDELAENRKG